ncbi:MAG TPA: type II toxin-antitoxin system death-on-curing family toxin [Candidatus Binatia bacterium]
MRYLTLNDVLELYRITILRSGGSFGIRDLHALESSLAQPRATYADEDLYPTVVEKAAVLGISLIQNRPFVDGNKRIGHVAMETFLVLNGFEVNATIEEQELIILTMASGKMTRDEFLSWLKRHITEVP